MKSRHEYKYDIGISYARADEALVNTVVSKLRDDHGLSIFIDLDITSQLRGSKKHLRRKLAQVFEKECALIVAIVTADWIDSEWCHDEFQAAYQIIEERDHNCFLPIKIRHLDRRKEIDLEEHFLLADLISTPYLEMDSKVTSEILQFYNEHFPEEIPTDIDTSIPQSTTAEKTGKSEKVNQSPLTQQNFRIQGLDLDMIWIKPGSFMMGSPSEEDGRGDDETLHEVCLTRGFWMGKYPVTQGQWKSLMDGDNPSGFKELENSDLHPVERVSWNDCQEFIERLNGNQKYRELLPDEYQYRLPTEAEWEYACRAGTKSPYNGPKGEALIDLGWYSQNSDRKTHPVGKKKPNSWGLLDMHGNVWEWCHDWYGPYSSGPVSDPSGPDQGWDRVVRGGSWGNNAGYCRSAVRFGLEPDYPLGFRLAAGPVIPD